MEILFDSNGHITHEGSLDYSCNTYNTAIKFSSDDIKHILLDDCQKAFTCREVPDGEKYSQGCTYFIGAAESPRCTLDKLAQSIFSYHTRNATFDPKKSGAEWWTLYLDHIDDVGFHWDRDYGIEEECGVNVHPHLATVTYLSSIGGPTVILDVKGGASDDNLDNVNITKCVVSKPACGKHICFDGTLLHGAPSAIHDSDSSSEESDDSDSEESDSTPPNRENTRVTFLVNIWLNHIPTQSEPAPDSLVRGLSKDLDVSVDFSSSNSPISHIIDPSSIKDLIPVQWSLSANEREYTISIPMPCTETLNKLMSDKVLTLDVDCSRTPGTIIPDDSSESDESNAGATRDDCGSGNSESEIVKNKSARRANEDSDGSQNFKRVRK